MMPMLEAKRSTRSRPPGSDAYASDKGVFVKPTRAGVTSVEWVALAESTRLEGAETVNE